MPLRSLAAIVLPVIIILLIVPPAGAKGTLLPVDVIIDAGHGGVDSGAFYNDLYEKDINLQVARMLYDELNLRGFRVILNRTGDYALSEENEWLNVRSRHVKDLAQRAQLAAQLSPKLMVSLHVNWARNPRVRGPLLLYQPSLESITLAQLIQHALNGLYERDEQPVAGRRYYLLHHSACPTVIVEMGFITNQQDRHILTSEQHQRRIAQAIAAAIEEYLLLFGHLQETKP